MLVELKNAKAFIILMVRRLTVEAISSIYIVSYIVHIYSYACYISPENTIAIVKIRAG